MKNSDLKADDVVNQTNVNQTNADQANAGHTNGGQPGVEEPNVGQREEQPPAEPDRSIDQMAQLRAERDSAKADREELKELLLRRQAEFDNFRKRTERERSEYLQFASMEAVRDLLPVLDDFERALRTESGSAEYVRGVEMIYNRMYEALKKLGLEPIATVGTQFDPHLHQAIERVETSEAPDNTVLGEFQRGYHFKGKLLRPSMVRVAVNS